MESDIIEDNYESLKGEKLEVNVEEDKNEILEDNSDAKMTLVVTSDDDSKDSAKNHDNKLISGKDSTENEQEFFLDELHEGENCVDYVDDERIVESPAEVATEEPMPSTSAAALLEDRWKEEEEEEEEIAITMAVSSEKRKLSVDSLLDEDEEFYGFDETTGEPLAGSKNKRVKTSDESEEDEEEEILPDTKEEETTIDEKTEMEEKSDENKDVSSSKENLSSPPPPPVVTEEEIPEQKKLEVAMKDDDNIKEETKTSKTPEPEDSEKIKAPNDVEDNKTTPVVNAKQKTLKDAIYRKPFDMGWKREFVYRAISGMSKEKGEVYYITPTGKRLRTKHEVQQNITPGLSLDNFTFAKEPLGAGANEEIIRSAKPTVRTVSTDVTLGKRIPKPKAPKGASPPPQGWTPAKAVKSVSNAQSPRTSQSRTEETESKHKSSSKGGKSSKKGEPCTIQCALAMGMIPQLQCIKCLCLYHHECVGLDRNEYERNNRDSTGSAASLVTSGGSVVHGSYICELCKAENLSTNQTTQMNKTITQSPPKSQPSTIIAAQNPVNSGSLQHPIRKNIVEAQKDVKQINNGKGLAQSVASANSVVPVNKSENIDFTSTLPQSIAVIKGRKYVVIRKPKIPYYRQSEDDSQNQRNENSSSSDQSHPTLQTGDDLPVRKRISTTRNKNSPDVQRPVAHQQMQIIQPRSSFETFSSNFFGNISIGYDMMFQVFQYLTVQELLRAACVCRVWYDVAHHRSLWRTVRMKNSQVDDWKGLAETLVKHETKHLDLRKILIASSNIEEIWRSFSKNIKTVVNLEGIELCKCSAKIIENLFQSNPKLKLLNALSIKDDVINLENVNNLDSLEELRLKSVEGLTLENDLSPFRNMKTLKHLGLTSFRHFSYKDIAVLGEMTWLESLELGDCNNFVPEFATEILPKLTNLKRLRLEGQENCGTFEVLETVSKLHRITQLELVNFEIKVGFDEKLVKCKNIERLLIIPTYISQSAATNNIVLSAVLRLSSTLRILTWAITMELLRVTSLYVVQCDNKRKDKKFFEESIPVMKPVPGINDENEVYKGTSDFAQIEILPLVKVEKILTLGMPTTKFKIVKVPYNATWRQNLE